MVREPAYRRQKRDPDNYLAWILKGFITMIVLFTLINTSLDLGTAAGTLAISTGKFVAMSFAALIFIFIERAIVRPGLK